MSKKTNTKNLLALGVVAVAMMLAAVGVDYALKTQAATNVYTQYSDVVDCDQDMRYLGEDRSNTGESFLGDWEGNYGSYAYILSGMNVTQGGELPIPNGDSTGYDVTNNAGFYGSGEPVEYKVYTKESSSNQNCDMLLRSLETADETQRRAACYYTSGTMNVGLTLPAGNHQLTLYFLDYDPYSFGRNETVTVDDSSTDTPVSEIVADFYNQGVYKKFAVYSDGTTPVKVSVSSNVARNAVISGLFVDPLTSGTPLSYLGEDRTTNGDWQPTYGYTGYLLAAMNGSSDSFGGVINSGNYTVSGGNRHAWTTYQDHDCLSGNYAYGAKAYMWTGDTSFYGALTCPEEGVVCGNAAWTQRATTWDDHSSQTLMVDLDIAEEGDYLLTVYATDYDRWQANQHEPRQQILHVYDSEGNEIMTSPTETPTYPSAPHQADPDVATGTTAIGAGVYHTFYVTEGSYTIEVQDFYGNAVISGIFVDKIECESCEYTPYVTDLMAGQHIDVGDVIIANDEENLYITYKTQDGWELSETHFHVADSVAGIPQTKKGNPIPGQFDYSYSYDPTITEITYTLSLAELGVSASCGDTLYIATHAVVGQWNDDGEFKTETGWGNGPGFVGSNWAMYFTYDVQCCDEEPEEPGETGSETAFAFGGEYATCFLDIDEDGDGNRDFSRWGWTNGVLSEGDYTFDVYAGAGQCDLEKGTFVGTLSVSYHNGTAVVTYNAIAPYSFSETHLYIGSLMLAQNNGSSTVAPGQYPYIMEHTPKVTTYTYTVNGLSGDIYVVAHAVAYGFPL